MITLFLAPAVFATIVRTIWYSSDQMAGEAKIFCYVCEECRYYDGNLKNKDMRCKQCENYIVTNEHAERLRKKIKVVKK